MLEERLEGPTANESGLSMPPLLVRVPTTILETGATTGDGRKLGCEAAPLDCFCSLK